MTNKTHLDNELRTIRLTGELGRRFGFIHRLVVSTPAEAIRALCVIRPGFKKFLMTSHEHHVEYKVLVGREVQTEGDLHIKRPAPKSFTFAPVFVGGKKAGALQTIVGAVLIVVGVVINAYTGGTAGNPFIGAGFSMLAGGVIQLLTKLPRPSPSDGEKNPASAYFNGAVNTVSQGGAVPVCYGKMIVGSAQVSLGISSDKVAI